MKNLKRLILTQVFIHKEKKKGLCDVCSLVKRRHLMKKYSKKDTRLWDNNSIKGCPFSDPRNIRTHH